MYPAVSTYNFENDIINQIRIIADRAFSRAAGAPLLEGNHVRLLKNADENYPVWLDAIASAEKRIYFENYLISEDDTGQEFADALVGKAREGVRVRVIYDWMGCFHRTSRKFWNRLREGGVEVRCYNPPRLYSPFGWVSRDHRKTISVDGRVGFVTGLCVAQMWKGVPERNIEPWRDTGVEVHGSAVKELEHAFAQVWKMTGEPVPEEEFYRENDIAREGDMNVRVIAGIPATADMFRLDQLVTALARKRLWLTDAYYTGTLIYVQALKALAKDGGDVRLLVPNVTNIPFLKPLSRVGYHSLLEAGVRVFEWNGSMLHAKTAVADGQWARVGSTNLNIASWFGNCELDLVVENASFAREMEEMYLDDLRNSTEIVLDRKRRLRSSGDKQQARAFKAVASGSGGRARAGVMSIGSAVGSVFTGRRLLEPVEARLMTGAGTALLLAAVLVWFFPWLFLFPVIVIFTWLGILLVFRGFKLRRKNRRRNKG